MEGNIKQELYRNILSNPLLNNSDTVLKNMSVINIDVINNFRFSTPLSYPNIFFDLAFEYFIKSSIKKDSNIGDKNLITSTCLPIFNSVNYSPISRRSPQKIIKKSEVIQNMVDYFLDDSVDVMVEEEFKSNEMEKELLKFLSKCVDATFKIIDKKKYKNNFVKKDNVIAFDVGLLICHTLNKVYAESNNRIHKKIIETKMFLNIIPSLEKMINKSLYDNFLGENKYDLVIVSKNFIKDFYKKDLCVESLDYKHIRYFEDIYYRPYRKIIFA